MTVRAYAAGSFRIEGTDRVNEIAAEVAAYRQEGFHAVKVKLGFDVEEDLKVVAAVRDAIGPDLRLMIDANHGYDVLEAVELGRRAAQYAIDWFEEPVLPEQLDAYRGPTGRSTGRSGGTGFRGSAQPAAGGLSDGTWQSSTR